MGWILSHAQKLSTDIVTQLTTYQNILDGGSQLTVYVLQIIIANGFADEELI